MHWDWRVERVWMKQTTTYSYVGGTGGSVSTPRRWTEPIAMKPTNVSKSCCSWLLACNKEECSSCNRSYVCWIFDQLKEVSVMTSDVVSRRDQLAVPQGENCQYHNWLQFCPGQTTDLCSHQVLTIAIAIEYLWYNTRSGYSRMVLRQWLHSIQTIVTCWQCGLGQSSVMLLFTYVAKHHLVWGASLFLNEEDILFLYNTISMCGHDWLFLAHKKVLAS